MNGKFRWKNGETNPVVAAIDSSVSVEIGDLLYLNSGKALPASSLTAESTLLATQKGFAAKFLGVAMQSSANGSTTPIRVATSGVFELDCVSTTYELGETVGAYASGGSVALSNQKTVKVSDADATIGKVARREPSANDSVYVSIRSKIFD